MNDYPFQSKFLELPEGKIYYIDEGKDDVIVFSHGTPEWSFGYRHIIAALSKSYRCIAIDHLGFGLSDKSPSVDYSIPQQARRFELLVTKLDLKNITLVANDFGVSIALSYALNHPDNVKRISISNGWMWSLKKEPHFARPGKLLQGWIGKLLYIYLNFSVKVLMPQAYGDKAKLTKEIHQQYRAPFKRKADRAATLVFAREILNASDWWENQWNKMDRLAEKPFLIFWGMKDALIRPVELQKWKGRLKNYKLIELPSCGHFPHEENPERMIDELNTFLKDDYAMEGDTSGLRPSSFINRA